MEYAKPAPPRASPPPPATHKGSLKQLTLNSLRVAGRTRHTHDGAHEGHGEAAKRDICLRSKKMCLLQTELPGQTKVRRNKHQGDISGLSCPKSPRPTPLPSQKSASKLNRTPKKTHSLFMEYDTERPALNTAARHPPAPMRLTPTAPAGCLQPPGCRPLGLYPGRHINF